jgi:alkanesulfonate monooxygenase SsuD/methylene tetrahydromethanopterin reductase-like flavin-dependent oxidoreductase (luciferase family)
MNIMKAKGNISEDMSAEKAVELGFLLAGSPKTVRQRIEETQKQMGYGHFMTQIAFGTMPKELSDKSLTLFATEVMQPMQSQERQVAAE